MSSQIAVDPFRTAGGHLIAAAFREGSTTFGIDDRRSLSFDGAGRLIRAFWKDRSIRRSLDNRFVETRRAGPYAWSCQRRELPAGEASDLVADARRELVAAAERLGARAVPMPADHAAELAQRLRTILQWDATRLAADGAAFRSVYLPVPILPPDQYRAVVVQATEGCAHNACSFCGFYRDRRFRAKSTAELRSHLRAVREFFGDALVGRRQVFLADANALALSVERLCAVLDLVRAELPPGPDGLRGVASFVDAFSGIPKSAEAFRMLAARGLGRVYLGLESGCDPLLQLAGKPATAAEAVALTARLKAAGIAVGVILLLGIGGSTHADRHVDESLTALGAMGLGRDDIVYLSPLVADPESPYRREERRRGIRPLDDAGMDAQQRRLRSGIRPGPAGRPRIALYDIRDFLY